MLSDAFALAGAALSLDRAAWLAARDAGGLAGAGWLLALLAGLSLTIGQSVILFANGVSRTRFVLCLLLFAVVFVAGLLTWGVSIWVIATYGLRLSLPRDSIALAICLGQAPLLFGFLVLVPYLGSSIRRILEAYSLVIVLAALSALFEIRPLTAVAIGGLGWALETLTLSLLQRPLAGMRLWLWQVASGRPVYLAPHELRQSLATEGRPGDRRTGMRP